MKKKTLKIIDILITVATVICLIVTGLFVYRNIVYEHVIVSGTSMQDTLDSGDYGLMNVTDVRKQNIQRFDIVIFDLSKEEQKNYDIIKRVIALPGETIKIDTTGTIYINNEELDQSSFLVEYQRNYTYSNNGVACGEEYKVPNDAYFCLGDNRKVSLDSRVRGALSRDKIDGVLRVIYKHCNEEGKACKSIPARWF